MEIPPNIEQKLPRISELAHHYGITKLGLFGSRARGDNSPDSDYDFIVEMEKNRSLFDLGGFQIDTQELLEKNVDVVTQNALHPSIRDQANRETLNIPLHHHSHP